MELSLTKLPWYAQIGAFVALVAGANGAFYYYEEMPMRADMASRQTQLKALRDDITKGLNTAKQLPAFRAQVTELEGRLDNLKAVLPEEKDAADLLRRMQTVAMWRPRRAAITVSRSVPSNASSAGVQGRRCAKRTRMPSRRRRCATAPIVSPSRAASFPSVTVPSNASSSGVH